MVIILVFTILFVFDGSLACYDADLFTHMIWVYFVCLNFQHMKRKKKKEEGKTATFITVFRHVLQLICFPVQNMPSSGVSVAHV